VDDRDGTWRRLLSPWRRLRQLLRTWRERGRSRRELLLMDEHILHDMGIDCATARYEGTKPFWMPIELGGAQVFASRLSDRERP
jgi:uncharacterized protein YjiS (DUF1127 family)